MGNFTLVPKAFLLIILVLLAGSNRAQTANPINPEEVAPQVIINVRKHPIGPDMVEITMAKKDYPLELLRQQALAIAKELGSEARGLSVTFSGYDPSIRFAKASFATDGIIDKSNGLVRLQALVRGMIGSPEPWLNRGFLISLEGEQPIDRQTLKNFTSKAVVLKATATKNPNSIEYRIVCLTNDPQELTIPDKFVENERLQSQNPSKRTGQPEWILPLLVGIASISALALVYFAVSRSASNKQKRG